MSTAIPRLALENEEIHLWFAYPEEIQSPHLLKMYRSLMSKEETEQFHKFHFEKHQHQHLLTRALIRCALSHYAPLHPLEWEFVTNDFGKPVIQEDQQLPTPIQFNITHTEGIILCAVMLERELGVDAEWMERDGQTIEIAERYFSPSEVAQLKNLDPKDQKDRFYELWTLKESFIKACGKGLSMPLEEFSFTLTPNRPIEIQFHKEPEYKPKEWQFWQYQLSPQHKAALAVRCGKKEQRFRISMRKSIPMDRFTMVTFPAIRTS